MSTFNIDIVGHCEYTVVSSDSEAVANEAVARMSAFADHGKIMMSNIENDEHFIYESETECWSDFIEDDEE